MSANSYNYDIVWPCLTLCLPYSFCWLTITPIRMHIDQKYLQRFSGIFRNLKPKYITEKLGTHTTTTTKIGKTGKSMKNYLR